MNTHQFVSESNRIEGILREPAMLELAEFDRFMALDSVTVGELEKFVKVYQRNARLRDRPGLNVIVGNHRPPSGGPEIRERLENLLESLRSKTPHANHVAYENLHPFTDGNGRSGRMLWAWQMRVFPLGFLHHFYYQTLAENQARHE